MSEHAWPDWWQWELELSSHLLKRMVDRGFTETDLRAMLEEASSHRPDVEAGRWVIEASHSGCPWHVIVEPDSRLKALVVVTAYSTS